MTEWKGLTAKDYMDIKYIYQAYNDEMQIKNIMKEKLNREVTLNKIEEGLGIATIPYPEFINIIERNIDILTANGYIPSTMKATRNWLGETKDNKRFKYSDVNRWFESFIEINNMVLGMSKRVLVTSTFFAGTDKNRQMIRAVRH